MMQYLLNCGRKVSVEECYISLSTLGYLAGSKDAIRADIIRRLPERAREQFPRDHRVFIKPLPPDLEFPIYVMMAVLSCDQPVSDANSDFSSLVVCWLSDDIETSLPDMIEREIRAVEWEDAVDGNF